MVDAIRSSVLEIRKCKSLEIRRVNEDTHPDVVVVEDLGFCQRTFRSGELNDQPTVVKGGKVLVPPVQRVWRQEGIVVRWKADTVLLRKLEEKLWRQSAL